MSGPEEQGHANGYPLWRMSTGNRQSTIGNPDPAEVIVWTDGPRCALVAAALDLMGNAVTVRGVGGPRVAEVDELARRLSCVREDDLRKLVVDHHDAAYLVVADGAFEDVADVAAAAEAGVVVLELEPVAADADALALVREPRGGRRIELEPVPAFMEGPGWTSAADPREPLGAPHTLVIDHVGRTDELTLFARLLDAWRTVLRFVPMPQSVDAQLSVPPDRSPGRAPRNPRGITGSITAHARIDAKAAVVLHVSDQAAAARRRLHVLGAGGELLVRDTDYALYDRAGALIDEHRPKLRQESVADLIAHHWRRVMERPPGPPTVAPTAAAEALACCQACLLSARTGAPEDPRKLMALGR